MKSLMYSYKWLVLILHSPHLLHDNSTLTAAWTRRRLVDWFGLDWMQSNHACAVQKANSIRVNHRHQLWNWTVSYMDSGPLYNGQVYVFLIFACDTDLAQEEANDRQ